MKKKLSNLIFTLLIVSILVTPISLATNTEQETSNIETKEHEKTEIDETEQVSEKDKHEKNDNTEKSVESEENNTDTDTEKIENNTKKTTKQEKNVKNDDSTLKEETTFEPKKEEKPILADGIYEIHSSIDESKVVNIFNATYSNCTNVNIATNKKLKTQKFYITFDKEKEAYIIKALQGDKVLDVDGGRKQNYSNVQLYEYNGSLAQQWEIKEIESKKYNIISKNSSKCLDIKWRSYTKWLKYTNI